ncbi:MAG: hypothetical protein Q7S31_03110 [bacterium]|nr:hypothetical protein [bacterium]
MNDYQNTNWWKYLEEPMRDLVKESYLLMEREEKGGGDLHDYSFIVFPMAKAYEGFLKKLFFDLGLINKRQYEGDRFRVGKSLNPNLPKRYQWDWVYIDLVDKCHGEQLPGQMWDVWKRARNRIFHYFAGLHRFITLAEAKQLIGEMASTMEAALAGCATQSRLV